MRSNVGVGVATKVQPLASYQRKPYGLDTQGPCHGDLDMEEQ